MIVSSFILFTSLVSDVLRYSEFVFCIFCTYVWPLTKKSCFFSVGNASSGPTFDARSFHCFLVVLVDSFQRWRLQFLLLCMPFCVMSKQTCRGLPASIVCFCDARSLGYLPGKKHTWRIRLHVVTDTMWNSQRSPHIKWPCEQRDLAIQTTHQTCELISGLYQVAQLTLWGTQMRHFC